MHQTSTVLELVPSCIYWPSLGECWKKTDTEDRVHTLPTRLLHHEYLGKKSCNKAYSHLITYGSPIFKAVQQKWYKALCRALTKSPKSPEYAVGEGSEPSHIDRSAGVP